MIIVNGWKPLTIIIKRSILDVAAALDPPPVFHTGTCIGLNKLVVSVLNVCAQPIFTRYVIFFQLDMLKNLKKASTQKMQYNFYI